jgi:hypothetical protein
MTRQKLHLELLQQHDPDSRAIQWLVDSDDEPESIDPYTSDPAAIIERGEIETGLNCFDQPIN